MRGGGARAWLAAGAIALAGLPGPADAAPRPGARLVVMVVVDQLASTQMSRWGHVLDGGLARLIRRGAYYPNAEHDQPNTATAPGHATLVTGTWPSGHGVVSNRWCDPADGHVVYCVADSRDGEAATKHLAVPGLSDAVALATAGRGKTIALSLKDRVSVLVGGETAHVTAWYDDTSGGFRVGRWRGGETRPPWVETVEAAHHARLAFGRTWDRARPELDYGRLAGPDEPGWEGAPKGVGRRFPRVYGEGLASGDAPEWRSSFETTPAATEAVFALAEAAFDAEGLGRDDDVDLLFVGVSAFDYAGHWWGPRSQEVLDHLIRTDRALGRLIDHVESKIGAGAALWVVTSDHGSTDTPESVAALGIRAERVDAEKVLTALETALAGATPKGRPATTVAMLDPPFLFLGREDPKADRVALARAAAAALSALPEIAEAVATVDLASMSPEYRERYARVLFPGRSPDVLIRTRPYDLLDPKGYRTGTGHGSPYTYDTRVPLVIAGPGVRAGRDPRPYPITRLAPTIAALAGFEPPASALEAPLPAAAP